MIFPFSFNQKNTFARTHVFFQLQNFFMYRSWFWAWYLLHADVAAIFSFVNCRNISPCVQEENINYDWFRLSTIIQMQLSKRVLKHNDKSPFGHDLSKMLPSKDVPHSMATVFLVPTRTVCSKNSIEPFIVWYFVSNSRLIVSFQKWKGIW